MTCPVELARDLSAKGRLGVKLTAGRRQDEAIPGGRLGGGDEDSRGHLTSDAAEDHRVAGGGDHRHFRPEHTALAEPGDEGSTVLLEVVAWWRVPPSRIVTSSLHKVAISPDSRWVVAVSGEVPPAIVQVDL